MRIAILDDYQNAALAAADWSALDGRADITVFRDHLDDPDALAARLAPFQIVCAMRERTPFPRALFARLPALKLIVSTGMANAAIDLAAARDHGVTVCGTRGNPHGAPELTWALILAALRQLPAEAASVRAGGWQTGIGGDLHGRTLAILGLGTIGAAIAKVGRAFGMDVIAWSQNLTQERAAEHGATLVSREDLFVRADILTIHLKLSDRSRGLIGRPELALMKPDALLVNTARGPIIDEAALLEALQTGRIFGAALDVFDQEPLPPEHPFRTLPNVLTTPHIGYVTRQSYAVFFRDTVEDIVGWLAGSPLRVLT